MVGDAAGELFGVVRDDDEGDVGLSAVVLDDLRGH